MTRPDEGANDRAERWWRAVEAEVALRQEPGHEADGALPDPWAGAVPHVAPLTDEQHELLVHVADQPQVARLQRLDPLDLANADHPEEAAPVTDPGERSALAAILDQAIEDLARASGEDPDPSP